MPDKPPATERTATLEGVCLSGWTSGYIDDLMSTMPTSDGDEVRPASVSLEEAMARVMDQALAREGDTHAQWRLLNEPWKP